MAGSLDEPMSAVRRRGPAQRARRRRRRRLRGVPPGGSRSPSAARTAATAARAATSGSSPTTTSPRCWRSATTRTAAPRNGVHGKGKDLHGRRGEDLEVAVPEGTVVTRPVHRRAARRAAAPRRPLAGRGRRPGRPGQRQVPDQPAAGADLRRAGRARRGALAQARAEADGRRRPRRLPQRRQEHADQRDLRGQAEDRRLPVHDARAEPRRRPPRRRHRVRRRRHPRPDRGRQRGQGPRPPVPAPRRAGPGAVPARRPRRPRRHVSPAEQERILLDELRRLPARAARAAPARRRHQGRRHRHHRSGRARFTPDGEHRFVISAVTGDGLRPLVGAMARLVHEARAATPRQEGVVLLRPEPTGAAVERIGENEFRVTGRDVERVVALNDVTTPDAARLHQPPPRAPRRRQAARAGRRDATATSCGSATSASTIERRVIVRVGRQDRHARRSPTSGGDRRRRDRQAGRRDRGAARRRARDRRGVVGRGRRRRGRPRAAQPARPTCRRCRRSPPPASPG